MTNDSKNRTDLNYDSLPLNDGEVLVLMPFCEVERSSITNPRSIVTVHTSRGSVIAVLKAVPKAHEATAKAQFNNYVQERNFDSYGRCLIPQQDGTYKACPKKKGTNHPDCAHCPHKAEYEREKPKTTSYEVLTESGWEPGTVSSPEAVCVRREEQCESGREIAAFFKGLINVSPKHALAAMLMAQGIKGEEFANRMLLEHDAANRVRSQIINLSPDKVRSISQLSTGTLKANRSKNDAYYLQEAKNMLDAVLKMYSAF